MTCPAETCKELPPICPVVTYNFMNTTTLLTTIIIVTQFIKYWHLSKGHLLLSYYLTIISAVACCILETSIALKHPEQVSLIFFNVLYVWMAIMAIKGILRLKEDENEKEKNKTQT